MADNTTLNAGSGGDVIASDDISGVKYQRIKLIHGADGTSAGDVSTSNGLPVAPLSVGHTTTVSITRPNDTTAYTAGDVIGDTNGSAILTFANMGKTGGGDIVITSVELQIDVSSIPSGMAGFNLRLYNASPTAIADNAAWDLPSGDRGKYIGKVAINVPVDEGATLFVDNDNINKQIKLSSSSLYVELQTIGAFTPTASSVFSVTIHTIEV